MKLSESTDLIKQILPKRWQRLLAFGLLWSVIGIVSAVHWWYFPPGYYPYTWWHLVIMKLSIWYSWGMVTLLILFIANRFQISRPVKLWNIVSLLLSSLFITSCYLLFYTYFVVFGTDSGHIPGSFEDMLQFVISRHSTFYYLAFWATVAFENSVAFYNRYHEQTLKESELKSKLAKAQLDVLRSQLQPHFLFNTLNIISSKVINEETEAANDLLVKLSDLLRFNLDHADNHMVTLRDEMKFTNAFIALMQARFQDKLTIEQNISSDVLDFIVPSMILQPLVENAIKYSAASDGEVGKVNLTIKTDNKTVTIQIKNNLPVHNQSDSGTGVGLTNTKERLESLYGDEATLTFVKESDKALVTLSLPIKESQQTDKVPHA